MKIKKCQKNTAGIVLAFLMIIQVALVSGITVSAENETPIVPIDTRVQISGASLILDGEIGLVYHVFVPKSYRSGYIALKCMDETEIMNITDCPRDADLRFMAAYKLSAIKLAEPVTINVYDAGDTPLAEASMSARDYAQLLLNSDTASEKEKAVAEKLVNYGHYAQLACCETNGWVIGSDYKEIAAFGEPQVDTSVFEAYDIEFSGDNIGDYSMSLSLDYKLGFHLYVRADDVPSVTLNGNEMAVEKSKALENTYDIEITGINALNLNDTYELCVNDDVIKLSPFGYCGLAVKHDRKSIIDAMRAMYEFYEATAEYRKK